MHFYLQMLLHLKLIWIQLKALLPLQMQNASVTDLGLSIRHARLGWSMLLLRGWLGPGHGYSMRQLRADGAKGNISMCGPDSQHCLEQQTYTTHCGLASVPCWLLERSMLCTMCNVCCMTPLLLRQVHHLGSMCATRALQQTLQHPTATATSKV